LCIFICRLILLIHLFLFLVLIHGAWPTGPRRSECARSAHDDLVYIYIYISGERGGRQAKTMTPPPIGKRRPPLGSALAGPPW
jgi:hypothetical protein